MLFFILPDEEEKGQKKKKKKKKYEEETKLEAEKNKSLPKKISQWESPEFDRLIPHLLPVWTRITWLPKTWLPGADGQLFPRSQSWESGCLWAGLMPVCLGWKTLALNTFCQVAFWQKPTQRFLAESFVGWSLFCYRAGIVKGHKSSGSSRADGRHRAQRESPCRSLIWTKLSASWQKASSENIL